MVKPCPKEMKCDVEVSSYTICQSSMVYFSKLCSGWLHSFLKFDQLTLDLLV